MKKLKKEEIAEDYCFVCKDGGDLRICDYGDCLKSYHAECEGKEDSFLDSEERWSCRWHQCFMCARPSKFQCFTCPMAVCGLDFNLSDFAQVRGRKAFCGNCLRLAALVEKNKDVVTDDEGVKVDFNEEATYERYFREYYNIIKEAEGLTAQMTLSAMARKGKQLRSEADNEDIHHCEDDGFVSDYDDICDDELEATRKAKKKRKRPSGRARKSQKSKASKFIGWGSRKLIAFLGSLGEDTTEPLSQYYVEYIVEKYIDQNKLASKKTVSCDLRLQSLFGRKQLKYHRISSLLESHFAENVVHVDQEDGVNASSSGEEDDSPMVQRQKEEKIISRKKSNELEAPSIKKSCYASIVAENINLIYLRKTLVLNLLKEDPEIFKEKVVGSFVRIKSDPYDCLQKSSRQLVKVTGVNEASTAGEARFLLQVSNRINCIPVSDISDEDFTPEELDDLHRRVDVGLLDKISVVDLERKARVLHEDVTKHWITRRLAVLQNQIDRANEKGWRKELHEYLEAKELLQSEAQQSMLLQEVPRVIAEEISGPPPPKVPEKNEKPENKLPQKIENESTFFLNSAASTGDQSSKVIELNKLQAKGGSRKEATKLQNVEGPDDPLLFSLAKVEVVSDSGDISDDLEQPIDGEVGSSTDSRSAHPGIDLEKASPAPSRVCELKKIFSDCLKLDLPTLFSSNHQSRFLESMTALSKIGDFSPNQIAAMEKLIYEFPRLSSNYQFAEDTTSVSQQFMQSHASLIEATKQCTAERERIEVREKSVLENIVKIEAKTKQLEKELKAINSERETLLSKKLELASKIKDKNAELAKSSSELDTWKIRQWKAVEEQETVIATWVSFKKLFCSAGDPLKVSPASSVEVVQQETRSLQLQTPNIYKEYQSGVKREKEPSPASPDEAPANGKSHQVYSHKLTEVQNMIDQDSRIWYHLSSSGVQQGPLSTCLLKSWCESSTYAAKLKVWKTGQTPDQAIPIADAILQFFPK